MIRETKKEFFEEWICPKCNSQNSLWRRKTGIGKKVLTYCNKCRKTTFILVKEPEKKESIVCNRKAVAGEKV